MNEDDARVGPVLAAGAIAGAVVTAIRADNPEVEIVTRGDRVHVRSPGRCVMMRARVEAALGHGFRLPLDLEAVMPWFRGWLRMTEETAEWI